MRAIRRLYDWVLHWAETPYGAPALFTLAFIESSIFPIPPDILLIALCIALPTKSWRFAAIASVGSLLGGIAGYGIGWGAWSLVSDFFFNYIPGFNQHNFDEVKALYDQYDFWVVFTAGFTFLPYKVITISAGLFKINFPVFVIASLISRSLRFFIVAELLRRFGSPVKVLIDKYFNLLCVLFMLLLIGGFVLVKYLM